MKNILFFGLLSIFIITSCSESPENYSTKQVSTGINITDSIGFESEEEMKPSTENDLAKSIDLNTKTPKDKKFIKTADLKFKVQNVLKTTEKIEDNAVKFGGYLTFSNLQNKDNNYNRSRISRDSIQISKQIIVENDIKLRVPNEKLDSFVRELNSMVLFLDYRVIKLSDVTLDFLATEKKANRLDNYDKRQTKNIDNKKSKLNETVFAEENLLYRQNEADELQLKALALKDQVKYCDLHIIIYQKPIIIKEIVADFEYVTKTKPNFFIRIWDSIVQGWWILGEIVVFLTKLWGIAILVIVVYLGIKHIPKYFKKKK